MDVSIAGATIDIKLFMGIWSVLTVCFAMGGAWFVLKMGVAENTRRITKLEESTKDQWKIINQTNTELATLNGELKALNMLLSKQ